jgi:hypothetical protein
LTPFFFSSLFLSVWQRRSNWPFLPGIFSIYLSGSIQGAQSGDGGWRAKLCWLLFLDLIPHSLFLGLPLLLIFHFFLLLYKSLISRPLSWGWVRWRLGSFRMGGME